MQFHQIFLPLNWFEAKIHGIFWIAAILLPPQAAARPRECGVSLVLANSLDLQITCE